MKKLMSPPALYGWDFDKNKISVARQSESILMAYFDMSAICDLHCSYCQAKSGKFPLTGELTFNERINIIDQLSDMGCESIHFAGQGEPTIDPLFWKLIEYTHSKGIVSVIFTHGASLSEKDIYKLKKLKTSIVLKLHSFNKEKQDRSVSKKGYTIKRDNALKIMIEAGFNKGEKTRLAVDTVITKDNYNEIESIFRWARQNNIFPEIKTLLTANRAGKTKIVNRYQVSAVEVKDLANRILKIDNEEFGFDWIPTPPYIGWTCTFYYYHIYVNILGDMYPCVGFVNNDPIGNTRKMSIKEAYNTELMKKVRNIDKHIKGICHECPVDCYGCACRRILKNGSIDAAFETDGCWSSII